MDALIKCLQFSIDDYDLKRPHGSLLGLTPHEAYTLQKPDLTKQGKAAKELRIIENQKVNCNLCS